MEGSKRINRISLVSICLLAIVLTGLNLYQHQQIKNAKQGIEAASSSHNNSPTDIKPGSDIAVNKNSDKPATFASAKNQTVRNEADELMYQIEAAEEELDMLHEQLADEEAKKAERQKIQEELMNKYREIEKKNREDPSYQERMKKMWKENLDFQYADLFKKLDLSPEKLEEFKDLMVEEMMAQQEEFYDYSNLSEEERDELSRHHQSIYEEYETKKSDFLGEDGYEIYQTYNETQGERYNVNAFNETLNTDEKLTGTQKESLIEAMHGATENIVYEMIEMDPDSSSNPNSEENIAMMVRNQDLQYDAYLEAAVSILSASQLEKWEAHYENEREQMKLMMEMSALQESVSSAGMSPEPESE